MTERMIIMLVAVGLLLTAIFGGKWFVDGMITEFITNMEQPPIRITETRVSESQWTPQTTTVGSFRAVNGANLTTEASGIVISIHFESGSPVSAGQRLVSLDTEADEAELERLKAAEVLATLELNRYQRLHSEGNISDAELQRRESEAAQAAAAVRTQEARIRQKTIRAPFDGLSGIRQVNVGQFVAAGNPVVSVQSLDPIYLNFSLPEREMSRIDTGKTVRVRVDAHPDREFTGTITALEPGVRESTRTFEIQATLDNPELLLRPGMFGRVSLTAGEEQTVLLVPQTALQFNPYGNSVYVIREDDDERLRVTRRFVTTAERQGDMIVIREGLEVGDRIATSGILKLRNEAVVEISDNGDLQPSQDLYPQPANQ